MTDEEKAEEYVRINGDNENYLSKGYQDIQEEYNNGIKQAFLYGLAEGRKEKWHDLRKNPNDLPDTNREVLVLLWDYDNYYIGRYEEKYDDVIRENTYWHFDDFSIGEDKLDTVLGWCERPKFEE